MNDQIDPDNSTSPAAQPPHRQTPHLRSFHPIPGKSPDGVPVVLLRDPLNLGEKQMVIAAQALQLLAQFQGQRTLDEIAEQFSIPMEKLVELVVTLDDHALLWGPNYEAKEKALLEKIAEVGRMPRGAAFMLGEEAEATTKQFDAWMDEVEDPELEETPRALVVPHLDYHRGWPLLATAYRTLRGATAPARVVILGTNHFGIGDGVIGTDWTWETPFGVVSRDEALATRMNEKLGLGFTVDQLDHVPEHSIQLHLPWVQHIFGDVPVFSVLVPDPTAPMLKDDGARTSVDAFTQALTESLAELGGETLFIASSDLSHVGPQFGEPKPVDEERSAEVEQHDRAMLAHFLGGDRQGFIEAMEWAKNPTRWCSIGNMAALLSLVGDGATPELLDYRQARDDKGGAMVSAVACAIL